MEKPILPMGTSGVSLINTQVLAGEISFVCFVLSGRGGQLFVCYWKSYNYNYLMRAADSVGGQGEEAVINNSVCSGLPPE